MIGMKGYTPLHYAASRGHLNVINILLKNRFPVNVTNDLLETPLRKMIYINDLSSQL